MASGCSSAVSEPDRDSPSAWRSEEKDRALDTKERALQTERAARLAAEEEIARLRRELERREREG
jgi:hypothetical protein